MKKLTLIILSALLVNQSAFTEDVDKNKTNKETLNKETLFGMGNITTLIEYITMTEKLDRFKFLSSKKNRKDCLLLTDAGDLWQLNCIKMLNVLQLEVEHQREQEKIEILKKIAREQEIQTKLLEKIYERIIND